MLKSQKGVNLDTLNIPKLPLRYGTDSCYISLSDSRSAADIIALRNDRELGKYVNYVELTLEDQERWLTEQLGRADSLNFSLIAQQRFAGILSLYNIEHGTSCEFGRMMMPNDGRRIYALAAEILGMSFAFEVLGVRTLYCVVVEGNDTVLRFHLRNGWKEDARYDRYASVNGSNAHLVGLSVERSEWPGCFAKMQPLARRLFVSPGKAVGE